MAVDTATETKLETLRAQLPAVHASAYFNAGSFGPLPEPVFEAQQETIRREFDEGRIVPGGYERARDRNRRVAALAAGIFGADADEIALTHSAGEGLNSALLGMPWEPGDEVVTTTEEHPGLLIPLSLLARRQGVVTRYADIGNGGKHVAEAIASQITSRTRAIAVSHLLWSTGAVIPLREISELARENELLVIVDAAQSAGQIPIDLHELGVDAYAMPGQKWLCGPESTGLLYIRRDRFGDILPTYTRYGQFETSGFYIPAAGAMRYEIGEFSGAAVAGQEAALHWLRDEVGFDWAHARISALGAALHQRLSRIDRVTVITPANAMAGMVNFTVEGVRPQEVTSALYERGYTIRYVDTRPCTVSARASVGWWNTEEEVSGLADAIARIAAGAGESLD
jgi:L-cysteine/cystine lyase